MYTVRSFKGTARTAVDRRQDTESRDVETRGSEREILRPMTRTQLQACKKRQENEINSQPLAPLTTTVIIYVCKTANHVLFVET
jgi:hypothetical protein